MENFVNWQMLEGVLHKTTKIVILIMENRMNYDMFCVIILHFLVYYPKRINIFFYKSYFTN